MSVQVFRGRTMEDARRAALEKLGAERPSSSPPAAFGGPASRGSSGVRTSRSRRSRTRRRPLRRRYCARNPSVPFAAGVYANASAPKSLGGAGDVAALRAELKGDIRSLKAMLAKVDTVPDGVASETRVYP